MVVLLVGGRHGWWATGLWVQSFFQPDRGALLVREARIVWSQRWVPLLVAVPGRLPLWWLLHWGGGHLYLQWRGTFLHLPLELGRVSLRPWGWSWWWRLRCAVVRRWGWTTYWVSLGVWLWLLVWDSAGPAGWAGPGRIQRVGVRLRYAGLGVDHPGWTGVVPPGDSPRGESQVERPLRDREWLTLEPAFYGVELEPFQEPVLDHFDNHQDDTTSDEGDLTLEEDHTFAVPQHDAHWEAEPHFDTMMIREELPPQVDRFFRSEGAFMSRYLAGQRRDAFDFGGGAPSGWDRYTQVEPGDGPNTPDDDPDYPTLWDGAQPDWFFLEGRPRRLTRSFQVEAPGHLFLFTTGRTAPQDPTQPDALWRRRRGWWRWFVRPRRDRYGRVRAIPVWLNALWVAHAGGWAPRGRRLFRRLRGGPTWGGPTVQGVPLLRVGPRRGTPWTGHRWAPLGEGWSHTQGVGTPRGVPHPGWGWVLAGALGWWVIPEWTALVEWIWSGWWLHLGELGWAEWFPQGDHPRWMDYTFRRSAFTQVEPPLRWDHLWRARPQTRAYLGVSPWGGIDSTVVEFAYGGDYLHNGAYARAGQLAEPGDAFQLFSRSALHEEGRLGRSFGFKGDTPPPFHSSWAWWYTDRGHKVEGRLNYPPWSPPKPSDARPESIRHIHTEYLRQTLGRPFWPVGEFWQQIGTLSLARQWHTTRWAETNLAYALNSPLWVDPRTFLGQAHAWDPRGDSAPSVRVPTFLRLWEAIHIHQNVAPSQIGRFNLWMLDGLQDLELVYSGRVKRKSANFVADLVPQGWELHHNGGLLQGWRRATPFGPPQWGWTTPRGEDFTVGWQILRVWWLLAVPWWWWAYPRWYLTGPTHPVELVPHRRGRFTTLEVHPGNPPGGAREVHQDRDLIGGGRPPWVRGHHPDWPNWFVRGERYRFGRLTRWTPFDPGGVPRRTWRGRPLRRRRWVRPVYRRVLPRARTHRAWSVVRHLRQTWRLRGRSRRRRSGWVRRGPAGPAPLVVDRPIPLSPGGIVPFGGWLSSTTAVGWGTPTRGVQPREYHPWRVTSASTGVACLLVRPSRSGPPPGGPTPGDWRRRGGLRRHQRRATTLGWIPRYRPGRRGWPRVLLDLAQFRERSLQGGRPRGGYSWRVPTPRGTTLAHRGWSRQEWRSTLAGLTPGVGPPGGAGPVYLDFVAECAGVNWPGRAGLWCPTPRPAGYDTEVFHEDTEDTEAPGEAQGEDEEQGGDLETPLFEEEGFTYMGVDPDRLATVVDWSGPARRLVAWRRWGGLPLGGYALGYPATWLFLDGWTGAVGWSPHAVDHPGYSRAGLVGYAAPRLFRRWASPGGPPWRARTGGPPQGGPPGWPVAHPDLTEWVTHQFVPPRDELYRLGWGVWSPDEDETLVPGSLTGLGLGYPRGGLTGYLHTRWSPWGGVGSQVWSPVEGLPVGSYLIGDPPGGPPRVEALLDGLAHRRAEPYQGVHLFVEYQLGNADPREVDHPLDTADPDEELWAPTPRDYPAWLLAAALVGAPPGGRTLRGPVHLGGPPERGDDRLDWGVQIHPDGYTTETTHPYPHLLEDATQPGALKLWALTEVWYRPTQFGRRLDW